MAKYKFFGGNSWSNDIKEELESSNQVGSYSFEKDVESFLRRKFQPEKISNFEIEVFQYLNLDSDYIHVSFGVSYKDYDWGLYYRIKAV